VRVSNVRHLTGGASRDTWALDVEVASGPEVGSQVLVLRRDLGGEIDTAALAREAEFTLLQQVHAAGILVPRPRWYCGDPEVLGAKFFLMDRLEGESVGRRVVREPALAVARQRLPGQMAEQLARIHAIPVSAGRLDFLPRPDTRQSPAEAMLQRTGQQLEEAGEPHPVLELARRWLAQRLPQGGELVLVHGDYRVGNLMVGPEGLVGIFDWEFAHVGDPHEDLAWPCVRSWRFGQDNLRLGGVGDADAFFAAYEKASGRTVDRRRIRWWEVLGNFRWALGCIVQASRHLSGQAVSLELASIGRRTAEMELELLDLMEAPDE
jgi:aminoglycoside phosphotransferase (APT) family kinase protein